MKIARRAVAAVLVLMMGGVVALPAYATEWNQSRVTAPCCSESWLSGEVDLDGLVAERQNFLDALVDAGHITQAEADDDIIWYRQMLEERTTFPTANIGGYRRGLGWCPWFSGDLGTAWGSEFCPWTNDTNVQRPATTSRGGLGRGCCGR